MFLENLLKSISPFFPLLMALLFQGKAAQAGSFILEAAPLPGIWGYPAVRAEAPLSGNFSAETSYSSFLSTGAREDFSDRMQNLRAGLQWTNHALKVFSLSLAAGAGWEQKLLGLSWQPPRSRQSPAGEALNYQETQNIANFYQSLGVRFRLNSFWTLSLRFTLKERIWKQSTISKASTIPETLTPHPSKPNTFQFRLYAGIVL